MRFVIELDCDNAAFGEEREDARHEVARIIGEAAKMLRAGYDGSKLFDSNGNSVGRFGFEE